MAIVASGIGKFRDLYVKRLITSNNGPIVLRHRADESPDLVEIFFRLVL